MKTKRFEEPKMALVRLDGENVIRTSSGCYESFDCQDCYMEAGVCTKYNCTGLKCPCLGALHI